MSRAEETAFKALYQTEQRPDLCLLFSFHGIYDRIRQTGQEKQPKRMTGDVKTWYAKS